MVTGLGLLLALPALAQENSTLGKYPRDSLTPQVLELKGILQHRNGTLEKDPPIPFEYWELHTAGKTYYLDLRGKQLLTLAEKLVNQPVVVTGLPEPASPTLRVTGLKADEFVKQTIHVEIRGKLGGLSAVKVCPNRPPQPIKITAWWIDYDGGKSYQLSIGSGELLKLANTLYGKDVVVAGTRVGQTIHVTGLKAAESNCQEKVIAEIQGRLERVFEAEGFHERIDWPPDDEGFHERIDWPPVKLRARWKITADGKTYSLDFGGNRKLESLASQLVNKTVVVTGRLQNGVVRVRSLWPVDSEVGLKLACPPALAGRSSRQSCIPERG
jgi:hypothetical protein